MLDHLNTAGPMQISVKSHFDFMKESENHRDAILRGIEFSDGNLLCPMSKVHLSDDSCLETLAIWRNKFSFAYPTQFEATPDSTRKWANSVISAQPDRILFLILDKCGNMIGHIGLSNCFDENGQFEVDNVVRGDASAEKGIMTEALAALMRWSHENFLVNGFCLRVMEDNLHAVSFYERNGFECARKIPLQRTEVPGSIIFQEVNDSQSADKHFLFMTYKNEVNFTPENMILTAGPSISAKEACYAFDAASKGWNRNWSKYIDRFEESFKTFIGAKYALSTSSCTGALQIALMAAGIKKGDEVLVPDQTWVATAKAVQYVGATPVFCDVELDSWNLCALDAESRITNKTKAIMPVHMYGHPARMDKLLELAKRYELKIIEDAAPAIGASYKGKNCGTFGDFGCFSFQGAKLLVTGEGGMLTTNDQNLYERAKKIWDHGRDPSKAFWIDEQGVKFKMSNVQAAIGLGQIERAEELIQKKRRIFSWYENKLSAHPSISLNKEVENAHSIYWMSSILLSSDCPITRDELMTKLRDRKIDTRPVFPAISQYPVWTSKQAPATNADFIGRNALNLPSGVNLSKAEVNYVADTILSMLG